MANDENQRVIGNSTYDEVLGRMIERTDQLIRQSDKLEKQLSQQSEKFERAITAVNGNMLETQKVLAQLNEAVKNLPSITDAYRELDIRLRVFEGLKTEYDDNTSFRRTVVRYGLLIAAAAVLAGGFGGRWLEKALSWGAR